MTGYERYRRKALLTQQQLADTLGITAAAVSNWEQGGTTPRMSILLKLSEMYGVPIEAIIRTDYPETDYKGGSDGTSIS